MLSLLMVVLPFSFFLSGKFANHQLVFNSANSNSISWALFLGLNIAWDRFGAPIRAVTDFSSVHFWEKNDSMDDWFAKSTMSIFLWSNVNHVNRKKTKKKQKIFVTPEIVLKIRFFFLWGSVLFLIQSWIELNFGQELFYKTKAKILKAWQAATNIYTWCCNICC